MAKARSADARVEFRSVLGARRHQARWPTTFGAYSRSWANKAQAVRAVLFASATQAIFGGRRLPTATAIPSAPSHG